MLCRPDEILTHGNRTLDALQILISLVREEREGGREGGKEGSMRGKRKV